MNITQFALKDIHPYERNPRKNDQAVEAVAESIMRYGFLVPLVISAEHEIITGHTRYKAAKMLGMKTVPCVIADDLNEEQIKAFRLVDNKVGEIAEWDAELLPLELADLAADMSAFGFDMPSSGLSDGEGAVDDDFDAALPEITTAKRGDIYQLGRHRLMCGDATSADDIKALMAGDVAGLLLTDPPYGVNIVKASGVLSGHGRKKAKVSGKVGGGGAVHFEGKVGGGHVVPSKKYSAVIGDETIDTACKAYAITKDFSKNQIIFGGNYFTDFLRPSPCWIVWDKQNNGNFADVELAWGSFDRSAKLYTWKWDGMVRKGSHVEEGKTRVHPTQKPAGLMSHILADFSAEGDIILDCFGGSGSTLIACEQINRTCCMMEISEGYVDVIIKRWEKLTGHHPVKIEEAARA